MRVQEGLCVLGDIFVSFTLLYRLLDLRSSECDVVSLYVVCCSVNVYVCFVCCVFEIGPLLLGAERFDTICTAA